jgi:hypothetical protein
MVDQVSLEDAARLVEAFGLGPDLTARIGSLERAVRNRPADEVAQLLTNEHLEGELVAAARTVKAMAGQINVLIHAAGVLVSLPYILEPDEIVESVSLGAGNTGRAHDLETDRRIAEFKMIDWRGGPETIRQNNVFADVFGLAATETDRRRVLYLLGTDHALRFLRGGRSMTSVLSRSPKVRRRFSELHGEDQFPTVGSYWKTIQDVVELVDLRELVPAFRAA